MTSSSDEDEPMVKLYHYTKKEAAEQIAEDGKINQSRTGAGAPDAVYGDGVYATGLRPNEHSVSDIAENNWDDISLPQQNIDEGKMDAVVVIEVPESRVSKAADDTRDVYVVAGDIEGKDIKDYMIKDESGMYKSKEDK